VTIPTQFVKHLVKLHGGGISDSNARSHTNLPLVLIGGGNGTLKRGRALRYPEETAITGLHLALLEKLGVHMDKFGDAGGAIET
jgi:hypothetical protein